MSDRGENEAKLRAHVRELNRCNQRGGRMLSLVDLLDAGTVDAALGGYLAAAMRGGASVMVGANPGGAGKTTVMAALLNWVPDRTELQPADSYETLRLAAGNVPDDPSTCCYVAHEIGSGSYFAYVWGREARAYLALTRHGYLLGTNLHADTLAEARHQLIETNGVAPRDVDAVHLKVFMRVERLRGWQVRRTLSWVHEGPDDRLIWQGDGQGGYARMGESGLVTPAQEVFHRDLLLDMQRENTRFVEDVRRMLLEMEDSP